MLPSKNAVQSEHGQAIPGFEKLRRDFITRLTDGLPGIQQAIEAGDFPQVRKFGHNLKGTGAPFGFPEITELGLSLEMFAKAADASGVHAVAAALNAYLSELQLPD